MDNLALLSDEVVGLCVRRLPVHPGVFAIATCANRRGWTCRVREAKQH